jgi:hypothetical protein
VKLALPDAPGRPIVAAAWVHLALLTVLAVPAAVGVDAFEIPVAVFCLASLFVAFGVWIVAFFQAAARTTRGDDIVVGSWVFLQGSAPAAVKRQLLGAAGLTVVVTIATMRGSPFVWLANLLPLAFCALWSARHGTFPARRNMPRSTSSTSRPTTPPGGGGAGGRSGR